MNWLRRVHRRSQLEQSGARPPRTFSLRSSQRGQAIVEAAGAVAFLLLLVIGIVDFAPAVVRSAQLTQAVRDGAAFARTAPTSTFQIRKRVVNSAPGVYGTKTDAQITAMTSTEIGITCTVGLSTTAVACSSAVVGDSITVTATYIYPPLTGLFAAIMQAPVEITRSATAEIF
jgi:Flp pilus assembly protein TadG